MKRSHIENTPRKVLLVVAVLFLLAPVAHAGIVDSPVPNLTASTPNKTGVRYSVPGVINSGSLGTYFACTSTAPSTQQVAVEVFSNTSGAPLNDAVATQLALGPGETRLFGTASSADLVLDKNLGSPSLDKGSARIVSTSKSLLCTAFVADTANVPPTSMVYLTMVKVHTQKGE